jgi:uncharacterized protein (TIGR01777 family)
MRIIITGGTGLIGRAMAENLSRDGHEVFILSRSLQKRTGLPPGVQLAQWDGQTAAGWGHLADGAGAIVNLAGASVRGDGFFPPRWTVPRKRLVLESRLNASKAVFDAIQAASTRPDVVIQASSIGYYGPRGDEEITEEAEPGDDFGSRLCVACENSLSDVEDLGVRYAVIRTGLVLSQKGGVLTRLALPFRFYVGGPFGSGQQWMSWIHIADEIWAIRLLLKNRSASGVFNLTAPRPVTNAEFSQTLGNVMGRPSSLSVPERIFRLALGEASALVLEGQRVVPQRLLDLGFAFVFPSLEPALRDLLG